MNISKQHMYWFKSGVSAVLFSLLSLFGSAQTTDSIKTLSPAQFIDWVREFHPVARQASILVDQSRAELLSTRGMFDPLIYFNNDQKTFDGKTYFNYNHTQLKIPTWFGIEVMAGLESNYGDLASPEMSLRNSSYAGLSIPLAKNLIIDRRRAALEQAQIFVELSKAEQQNYINDLLFEGLSLYWQWANDYQVYLILSDAVRNNEQRYKLIKITVEQGDRAGIDSTEALTQLLNFKYLQNQAFMFFQNSAFELSNFLWSEGGQPMALDMRVIPSILPEQANPYLQPMQPLEQFLQAATTTHPKLQMIGSKLEILEVERRLKFQSLLPTVNLKYNALNKGYEFWRGGNGAIFENNYKFGAEIGIPLFLRQGRGDYRNAKLKIQSTQLEQDNTRQGIENKVKIYYNEWINLLEQIKINEQAVKAYQKVFDVEIQKFQLGESTLFLLNSREIKVIEARQKLAELKAKFLKSGYGVSWAAGQLR